MIKITVNQTKQVTLSYPERTPEKVKQLISELKDHYGVTSHGLCVMFGMDPTEGNARNIRRWYSLNPKDINAMPEHQWFRLLCLVYGLPGIK